MAIRPATMTDYSAIVKLAEEQTARYPALRPDLEKIGRLAREAISAAKHFCMVSVDDKKQVQGVLVGVTGDNLWAQRSFCSVVLWVSRIPGDGAALLRAFRKWVVSRPAIRVAGFAVDLELDSRILRLMERVGFQRHGGSYLLYTRGQAHGLV